MAHNVAAVRLAIKNLLSNRLTAANGYSITAKPTWTFGAFDAKKLKERNSLASYPKIFVVSDSSKVELGVSGVVNRNSDYIVVVVLKADERDAAQDPEFMANLTDSVGEDLEHLFNANDTLGGLVHGIQVSDWTVDSGFCYPEAVVTAYLSVEAIEV